MKIKQITINCIRFSGFVVKSNLACAMVGSNISILLLHHRSIIIVDISGASLVHTTSSTN